jgi:integrase
VKGCVFKRGRTWTAVVELPRGEDGKRRQRWLSGFVTKREAEQAAREALGRVERGTDVEPTKVTVAEYLEGTWLPAVRSQLRPSTHASYTSQVKAHLVPRLGSVRLQALTAPMLTALYAELLEAGRRSGKGGLAPRSVRYVHTIIRKALADALEWNYVLRNVADAAKPPKQARPKIRTWTAEQLRAFLAHARGDRLTAAWTLASLTGVRRGELLGLRWSDVELDAGRLKIVRALVLVDYEPTLSEPKTERGRRTVALDPTSVAALREHASAQALERALAGAAWEDAEGYVFTDELGSWIHPQAFTDRFKRLAKAAGLPAIRLHELRHSHATLALEAGVAAKVVSDRLGHASVAFTMDTYADALPAVEETAAALVANLVLGS